MATTLTSREELRASLERHNAAFESLLRLIPPEFYLEREPNEDQWKSRFQKNTKKESAPRQALKEATKKAKRLKLDPANHKTLVDLQQEAAEAQAAASSKSTSSKGKQKAAEAIDSEDDNASDASDEPPSIHMDEDPPAFKPMPKRESVAHLRAKLHTRIEELRKGRKAAPYQEWSPKEHLLEEQRQAREEAHWNSRKESPVKRKEKPPLAPQHLVVPHVSRYGPNTASNPVKTSEPSFASVQFSGFGSSSKPSKHSTSSDPKVALKQLSSRNEKLATLPEERRKMIEEKAKWEKAQARLDGERLRDDPSSLKKTIKKKDKEKAKKTEKWADRKQAVKDDIAARQKKRDDNLASRHDRKKNKGSAVKKPKSRPGFEGGKTFGGGGKKKAGAKGKK